MDEADPRAALFTLNGRVELVRNFFGFGFEERYTDHNTRERLLSRHVIHLAEAVKELMARLITVEKITILKVNTE